MIYNIEALSVVIRTFKNVEKFFSAEKNLFKFFEF